MQQRSDEQLVMLIRNGNPAAFEILVQRYQNQVFSLAYQLGGSYEDAQDMAQDAFIRIYQELPKFDLSRRFFPWMYRVAHNSCINWLRQRPRETLPIDEMWDLADTEHEQAIPELSFASAEQSEAVREALQQLPENYRLPMILKYLEGMSYQKISEQLDLPVSTIETRLFRGRNILKKLLAEYIK